MLQVTDLNISYGQIEAVKGISFQVDEGQIVALIGANGAGKTTTLNAISGLHRPRAGSIKLRGQEISAWAPHRIVAAGVVHVPEGRAILSRMTVHENLELGQAAGARAGASGGPTIDEVYARFPALSQRRGGLAGNLSGGEQQMLAIARALLAGPQLLLMDEPSMGLAPMLVREIFGIVRDLNAEGRTILLVEQNSQRALHIANYAYVLERGQIVLEGTGAELLRNTQVMQAYLGGRVE